MPQTQIMFILLSCRAQQSPSEHVWGSFLNKLLGFQNFSHLQMLPLPSKPPRIKENPYLLVLIPQVLPLSWWDANLQREVVFVLVLVSFSIPKGMF